MITGQKKFSWSLFVTGSLISGYFGYLFAGMYANSKDLYEFVDQMDRILKKPFANYLNEYSLKSIIVCLILFCFSFLIYTFTQKNYMHGKEHGTSDWIDPKKITKELTKKGKDNNKIITENLKISIDSKNVTNLNNNLLAIGGSGKGKTFNFVIPNLLKGLCSYVVTDPKGEILEKTGKELKEMGYIIKVVNLVNMLKSNHYNPFKYVRKEEDVTRLINNLIANTTPKGADKGDPFWEKAESLYLQSLFYYVWLEMPQSKRNFNTLLSLLSKAEVREDGKPSELDIIMYNLENTSELGTSHPAVKSYYKCVRGAGDTVRSIIISANSRLAFFETKGIQRILSDDDLDLASFGIGKNGDQETKTALFCVIPDMDKSYNFVVGMLYTQLFQELYYQADNNFDGELPIPVEFWMDEFANVALPEDFTSLQSTMRSRLISCNIIIQNLAQVKALFEKTWETITGNCDVLLYLGGNEQSSHEYISKSLGQKTIDKRSTNVSTGKMGSSGKSFDVLGRELMTPAEVRKLKKNKAIVLVSGYDPIIDEKYKTKKHILKNGRKKFNKYIHSTEMIESMEFLNEKSMNYYEKAVENEENVMIINLTLEEIMSLPDDFELSSYRKKEIVNSDKNEESKKIRESEKLSFFIRLGNMFIEKFENQRFKNKSVIKLIQELEFNDEQMKEIHLGLKNGLTEAIVKQYMNPELSAAQMEQKRLFLEHEQEIYKNIA